jgi:diguanylate cyclase (GGDEF)-like protein
VPRDEFEQMRPFPPSPHLTEPAARPQERAARAPGGTWAGAASDDAVPQADLDDLTQILNRRGLLRRLASALVSPGWVVAYVDVDRFKSINDSGGHSAGDDALRSVARVMTATASPGSIIGRLGGDEFIVASPPEADPTAVGHRIRNGILQMDGHLSVSIGVASGEESHEVDELLNHADMALRRAKVLGRDRVVLFDNGLHQELVDRRIISEVLRWAVENHEFEVAVQPIWRTADASLAGGECLVRLRTPEGAVLRPAAWLDVAEALGIIAGIDWFVVNAAAAATHEINANRRHPNDRPYLLSVNLSPPTAAAADLGVRVEDVIRLHDVQRDTLAFEISERTMPGDLESAVPELHRLRELGVMLALDDFGSGHVSLIQIRDLPLDLLKLDRRFTMSGPDGNEMPIDHIRALASTVSSLGRALDLRVVFEGIEREEHLKVAREAGAQFAQGYHLARPMPIDRFVELARKADGQRELTVDPQPVTAGAD